LMTLVSYPNARPPKVATRATTPRRFRCGPSPRGGRGTRLTPP
jgi:hypothetical protein